MEELDAVTAYRHATANRDELATSEWCGCFYCLTIFKPEAIQAWLNDGTAFCPECQIDSVIGSQSGLPITRPFLEKMNRYWFSNGGVS